MLIVLNDVKRSDFTGRTGETIEYYWYRGRKVKDGVNIRFGSRNGDHELKEEHDLPIEKFELPTGQIMYKEVE